MPRAAKAAGFRRGDPHGRPAQRVHLSTGRPCYRCLSRLFGDSALTCVEAGVMAPLVGTIGTLQAMEAIKLLADYGQPLRGKLLMFDAMSMQFREMKLPKDPHCEVCGGE